MQPILITPTDLPLQSAPIRPEWVIEGQPVARNRVISKSDDGTAITLLWDCSAGRFNWIYDTDETLYIIEGEATLIDASGTRTFRAGDVVFFPAGSSAEWRVDRYIRKVAVFRYALPKPVGLVVRVVHKGKMTALGGIEAVLARVGGLVRGVGREDAQSTAGMRPEAFY